jgi:hypothetical protein
MRAGSQFLCNFAAYRAERGYKWLQERLTPGNCLAGHRSGFGLRGSPDYPWWLKIVRNVANRILTSSSKLRLRTYCT